jgi:hypothetical protein
VTAKKLHKDCVANHCDVGRRRDLNSIICAEWLMTRCLYASRVRYQFYSGVSDLWVVITDKSSPRDVVVFAVTKMKAGVRKEGI